MVNSEDIIFLFTTSPSVSYVFPNKSRMTETWRGKTKEENNGESIFTVVQKLETLYLLIESKNYSYKIIM